VEPVAQSIQQQAGCIAKGQGAYAAFSGRQQHLAAERAGQQQGVDRARGLPHRRCGGGG
jgi:hypothetical protein